VVKFHKEYTGGGKNQQPTTKYCGRKSKQDTISGPCCHKALLNGVLPAPYYKGGFSKGEKGKLYNNRSLFVGINGCPLVGSTNECTTLITPQPSE
jgi:hypothetical protein